MRNDNPHEISKDFSVSGTNKEFKDIVKSNPNFLWTFAVEYHPEFIKYIEPFITGCR